MIFIRSSILIISTLFLYSCQYQTSNQVEKSPSVKEETEVSSQQGKNTNTASDKVVTLQGHIRYQKMEGGFFGFIDNSGNKYTLINLPKSQLIDGLKIEIKGKIVDEYATTAQFGRVFKVSQATVLGQDDKTPYTTQL